MRAALYPRVSTSEQARDGYSIGEQIERMKAFCAAKGIEVHKVYTDAGFSGGDMNRPGLDRMLHDAEHNQFDVVIVYKLDRLSRSQRDTLEIIEHKLLPNNVDFMSVTESFLDTSTPYGMAMIGILSVFAQLEREQIKERVTVGREGRAKAGKWYGSSTPPVGYRYIDGELVVDEYEAVQIRELFRLFNMHIAPMRIMHILNDKGYRTSYGAWNRRGLKPIISNRVYIGEVSYSGTWYPGLHKAIVDKDVFDKAQTILDEHLGEHRRKPKFSSPIAGLVKCGRCGADYFIRKDNSRKDGTAVHFFTCYARTCFHGKWGKIPKEERCQNKNWRVEALEEEVMSEVRKLALDPDSFEAKEKPVDDEVAVITARIAAIDKQLDRYLDLYDSGAFDINKVNAKVQPLNEEKSHLTFELSKKKTAPALDKAEAVELASTLCDILDHASIDESRAIVRELIESIVIEDDVAHVYWRF